MAIFSHISDVIITPDNPCRSFSVSFYSNLKYQPTYVTALTTSSLSSQQPPSSRHFLIFLTHPLHRHPKLHHLPHRPMSSLPGPYVNPRVYRFSRTCLPAGRKHKLFSLSNLISMVSSKSRYQFQFHSSSPIWVLDTNLPAFNPISSYLLTHPKYSGTLSLPRLLPPLVVKRKEKKPPSVSILEIDHLSLSFNVQESMWYICQIIVHVPSCSI